MHILTATRFIKKELAKPGQSLLDRILRVARTLADLDHRDMPIPENVATVICWRDIAFLHAGRRGKNYVIRP